MTVPSSPDSPISQVGHLFCDVWGPNVSLHSSLPIASVSALQRGRSRTGMSAVPAGKIGQRSLSEAWPCHVTEEEDGGVCRLLGTAQVGAS